MTKETKYVELEMCLHYERPLAILVSDDGDEKRAVWLPRSQIEIEPKENDSNTIVVTVPEWLAKRNGLI